MAEAFYTRQGLLLNPNWNSRNYSFVATLNHVSNWSSGLIGSGQGVWNEEVASLLLIGSLRVVLYCCVRSAKEGMKVEMSIITCEASY